MAKDYKRQELSALYEISKILGSSLDLKVNLKSAMKVLAEFMDMKRGTVALKDNSEIAMVVSHGLTEEEIKRGRYKLGEGIIGKVAKLGSPIVIPNVGDEPFFLNKTDSRREVNKDDIAFLCVPIKFKSEVLGVLSVDRLFSSKGISFEEDLRLLKIIASLIAQSVKLNREVEKEKEALLEETEELRRRLKGKYSIGNVIGQSERMQEVFESVHRVAASKATALLRGESGTGKELIAKAIHYMSPRTKGPFIKFNCASIPEGLLESELLGHEKGAFTGAVSARKGKFELADKGTIFLDEIGDLPFNLQPKILRVLQEREFERVGGEKTIKVDVRLIAATSRNLEELVKASKFREDLYYRLNVVPIFLPALRERKEDIPLLTEFFLKRFNEENQKNISHSPEALRILMEYDWPGNVRELENTIERLVVMSHRSIIRASDLPVALRIPETTVMPPKGSLKSTIEETEKLRILAALEKTAWVQAKAAKVLGITPRQIGYKILKYGLKK
ncbi:MAG TPA: nif-specific transcriptional activator NifA [Nitrospiraceae bacterium]|jgi:Nif-specific regulatory protein|nr:nif-specific transcriptional activator NifA [Nitrospiraceae bacterium]